MNTRTIVRMGLVCGSVFLLSDCAARSVGIQPEASSVPDRIMPSDLLDVVGDNAYEIVRQLRPQWLRSRGPTSLMEPQGELPSVYVDNMRYGDLLVLQDIPIAEVLEIRFISGPDATTRWGTGVVAGVIEVIRKRK